MSDDKTAKASSGVSSQRAKRGLQHQSVPGDAVSKAAAQVDDGQAGKVSGATVTTAGKGFLSGRGRMGPPH